MFPNAQWSILELPPRHFSWRIRGNPLYWSIQEKELLQGHFDLLIATSMVDLSTLRGLVPSLASVPSLLYFHENQFAYPHDANRQTLVEAQMVSLYAALAADRLCFNSRYNLQSFMSGVDSLLARLPDYVPENISAQLEEKAQVLPVPYDVYWSGTEIAEYWPGCTRQEAPGTLRLLWVGRFEHDKGGEKLQAILRQLEQCNIDYELAITGQIFRKSPPVFAQIEKEFAHRLCHLGFLESHDLYRGILASADIVLSTANHEFQGLAVMEAVASGCLPVLPSRMAYPELYPAQYCYAAGDNSSTAVVEDEVTAAVNLILDLGEDLAKGEHSPPDTSAYTLTALKPVYEQAIAAVLAAAG
jgi:glycosyltransferase involved in cell wall biosynthesis